MFRTTHRRFKFLSQYFAKPADNATLTRHPGPFSPYSVDVLGPSDASSGNTSEDDLQSLRRATFPDTDALIAASMGSEDPTPEFVPKPVDALLHGQPDSAGKAQAHTPSHAGEHGNPSSVSSMLSSYLPNLPSMPTFPKLASYFPGNRRNSQTGAHFVLQFY